MGLIDWLFGKPKKSARPSALPETITAPQPTSEKKPTVPDRVAAAPPQKTVNPAMVALAEKYMDMDYPSGPMDAMLASIGGGSSLGKPTYTASASGKIQRASESMAGMGSPVDTKIVQVASCLKSLGNLNMFDAQAIAKAAMAAVEHYAALPKVRKFFLAPYEAKSGELRDARNVPVNEQCRILAGVENLLLEIYEELPYDGSIITDALVQKKIDQLVKSV